MDPIESATLRFLQAIKDSNQMPVYLKTGLEILHTVSWGSPRKKRKFKIVIEEIS